MSVLPLSCPVCRKPLHLHSASNGFYCEDKHRIDRHENGFWSFLLSKKNKMQSMSRQQMRTKQFLYASGLFEPLVSSLRQCIEQLGIVEQADTPIQHLDYQCAEGFYLRRLFNDDTTSQWQHWGVCDAENALFAANKQQTNGRLLLSSMKSLPISDNSMDLVTVLDSPMKGKECIRVLKPEGKLIMVVPDVRHLWQLRLHIYPDLVEKPLSLNLPKDVTVENEINVSCVQQVSAEQAKGLISMASFGWRADKAVDLAVDNIGDSEVEFSWKILVLSKNS